ncbi:MAG TPA: UDP-2,3-diacylglucosamine diphosphatase LpxI [Desulfopila sp.]|nr:UDP-2,3-diacylglucosamine diphosphatase LpxI [Desulfopila sp.]
MEISDTIGVIAGGGQFPRLFIEAARDSGKRPVVVGFKGETDKELVDSADDFCWVKLGQLGKVISFFKKNGVAEAVFLGTITKTRMFRDVFFDFKGLTLWRKIDKRHDDAILRAIADVLEDDGITVVESTRYLSKLLFPSGVLTQKKPTGKQKEDIIFGWRMAKEIGRLDIGQCVVVRDRTVLAVESIEGTDATILRGGSLGKEKVVVVKVHKPGQDFRFDLPATGLETIESMKKAGAAVLAVEAGKSLIFDSMELIREADEYGIVVVGVTEEEDGTLRF